MSEYWCLLTLQYCKSRKVRSSQHSAVEYYYSKCMPVSGARDFSENEVEVDKSRLEDLIRYLDNEKYRNGFDAAQTEFDQADSDAQEPAQMVDNNVDAPAEKLNDDDDETVQRAENEFQDLENDFHGRADDDFQEPTENVGVEFQEPTDREFVDDMFMEEQLDSDEPIIVA